MSLRKIYKRFKKVLLRFLLRLQHYSFLHFFRRRYILYRILKNRFVIITLAVTISVLMSEKFRSRFLRERDDIFLNKKFILLWTPVIDAPFNEIELTADVEQMISDREEGHRGNIFLVQHRCEYVNCYFTVDRSLLGNVSKFDAIAFGNSLSEYANFPQNRSSHQKYIFVSRQPAGKNAICNETFDGFFNWTWSYKLDSDIRWGLVIKDNNNRVVGPKKHMKWIKFSETIKTNYSDKLKDKKVSAAVVFDTRNKDNSYSNRKRYLKELQKVLRVLSPNELNMNSTCATRYECDIDIEKYFYFFLALEDATGEEYVSPLLLSALRYFTIPVVFGEANYRNFLPDGSYLNANMLSPGALATKMSELMRNHTEYVKYFEWKNYYRYHETYEDPKTNEMCRICALLNDENVNQPTVYKDFRKWWNKEGACERMNEKYHRTRPYKRFKPFLN